MVNRLRFLVVLMGTCFLESDYVAWLSYVKIIDTFVVVSSCATLETVSLRY